MTKDSPKTKMSLPLSLKAFTPATTTLTKHNLAL
jgi:hypothetical protein